MDDARFLARFHSRIVRLVAKMRDKGYRDSYIASHTRQFLARQMRALRGEASQEEFAKIIDKPQSVISSRLENPNYGKWTLQSLFEIASKLNVAVFVRFVDFQTFLRLSDDLSDSAVRPKEYDQPAMDVFVRESDASSMPASQFFTNIDQTVNAWSDSGNVASMCDLRSLGALTTVAAYFNPNVIQLVRSAPLAGLFSFPAVPNAETAQLRDQLAAKDEQIARLRDENSRLRIALLLAVPTNQRLPPTSKLEDDRSMAVLRLFGTPPASFSTRLLQLQQQVPPTTAIAVGQQAT